MVCSHIIYWISIGNSDYREKKNNPETPDYNPKFTSLTGTIFLSSRVHISSTFQTPVFVFLILIPLLEAMSLRTGIGSFAGKSNVLILSNSNHTWFGILTYSFHPILYPCSCYDFLLLISISHCNLLCALVFQSLQTSLFLFPVLVLVPLFIFPVLDSLLMTSYLPSCTLDSDDDVSGIYFTHTQ